MRSIFLADTVAWGIRITRYCRAGYVLRLRVLLGLIATVSVIIGVGYETTFVALSGNLILAGDIVLHDQGCCRVDHDGGRMGVCISPSLMVGALLGLSYGIIATSMSGSVSLHSCGHGRVAAAVLGAPISTTLTFEMTGIGKRITVLVTLSLATAPSSRGPLFS